MPYGCFNFSIPKLFALITFPPPIVSLSYLTVLLSMQQPYRNPEVAIDPTLLIYHTVGVMKSYQFPHLNNSGIGSLLSVLVMLSPLMQ